MKAAILVEQNKPLQIVDLTLPELLEGQVLVKLKASGICHSQLNEIKGKKGPDKYLPHTLGHEGSGIVEAVGPKVTKVKKGDYVILSWIKGSGINAAPPVYYSGEQKINSGQLSTFNEYTVTAENRVTAYNKEMPFDVAALLGCAVATGMGAVMNNADLQPGQSIAVFGAGGIGLSAVIGASVRQAGTIIAIDINDQKLMAAKEFGATHTVNARKTDVVQAIKEIMNGKGVDYAVESAGLVETMEQAFKVIRDFGGKTILIGNLAQGQTIAIDPFSLICGKQIVGSWGGETNPDRDYPKYVELYLSGKLKLDKLITHRVKLEEINNAFALMEKGQMGRGVIEL